MNAIKLMLSCVLLLLFAGRTTAQSSLIFSYDKGGNMIERKLQVGFGMRLASSNGITDTLPPLSFKIYPNPTNQLLNLEGELPPDVKQAGVRLMNISGQVLKTDTYAGQLKSMSVSDLKDGLYVLEINYSKKEKSVYKIIITH